MVKNSEIKALLNPIACACFLIVSQSLGISILIFATLTWYLLLLMFAKDEYIIPLFLFFIPFSTVLKVSVNSISFSSIAVILVFILKCLTHRKTKFSPVLILEVLVIVVVTFIASVVNNYGVATSHIMFIFMLVAFPFIAICTKDKVDFEICILYYSLGIIIATILALAYVNNSNLLAYINVFEDDTIVERHCGFYGDPNFYAAQVITAIGGQIILIDQKNKNKQWNILLLIALIVCGASSVSKSFLLCLVWLFVAFLLCRFRNGFGKFTKTLVVILLVLICTFASGIFSNIIDQYLFRFGMADDAASLTTGRSELWKEYLDFLINNPADLILGQGYTSVFKGVRKGSHNAFIQCLYQLGLVGTISFVCWISTLAGSLNKQKVSFPHFMLLIISCFSMWLGLDVMFFDDLFLTVLLFAFGSKYIQDKSKLQENVYV